MYRFIIAFRLLSGERRTYVGKRRRRFALDRHVAQVDVRIMGHGPGRSAAAERAQSADHHMLLDLAAQGQPARGGDWQRPVKVQPYVAGDQHKPPTRKLGAGERRVRLVAGHAGLDQAKARQERHPVDALYGQPVQTRAHHSLQSVPGAKVLRAFSDPRVTVKLDGFKNKWGTL
jgi:hypothetical protein